MKQITEIKELLSIVSKLQRKYMNRKFTLDGRLIGDIGEIIVEKNYKVSLYDKQKTKYDGYSNGKPIQIKTTLKNKLTFPYGYENIPKYYIGIKLFENGMFEEIYNGPGINIYNLIKERKKPKNGCFSISISTLKQENMKVPNNKKIEKN